MDYQIKPIEGFPGYHVDTDGQVWSQWVRNGQRGFFSMIEEKHLLKSTLTTYGYTVVTLCKDKKHRNFRVHKLVAQAFLYNYTNRNLLTLHKNNIPSDNYLNNLYLGTQKDNIQDQIEGGTFVFGEKNGRAKLNLWQVERIRFLYKELKRSQRELAKLFHVSKFVIHRVVNYQSYIL